MNFATELLNHPLVLALGWALVHFLWQGAVIAGILFVMLTALRRQSAKARYLAGCAALLLMALCPLATVAVLQYQTLDDSAISTAIPVPIPNTTVISEREPTGFQPPANQMPALTFQPNARTRLQDALPWLVVLWMGCVSALAIRLAAGYWRIRWMARHTGELLEEVWQEKLSRLAEQLRVSRPVRLCKSALVEVPTVIGWLRPVILFPVGALTGLPGAQLEAILAHELAHIRRHDYLVNLLQNLIETFLFYHPAVWWTSNQISQERELCCDDLALTVCGDRLVYAKALAALEESRANLSDLDLAADGGSLVRRIRRLMGVTTQSNRTSVWAAGAIALVLVTALLALGRISIFAAGSDTVPNIRDLDSRSTTSDPPTQKTYFQLIEEGLARSITEIDEIQEARVTIVNVEAGGQLVLERRRKASVTIKLHPNSRLRTDAVNAIGFLVANSIEGLKASGVSIVDEDGNVLAKGLETTTSILKEPVQQERLPNVQSPIKTNLVYTSPQLRALTMRLTSIVLPEVHYEGVPLNEVLSSVDQQVQELDSKNVGINLILVSGPQKEQDLWNVVIRIDPPLRNLTLRDALDAIVLGADTPIRYSAEDYAVVFTRKRDELFTRTIRVQPGVFGENLRRTRFLQPDGTVSAHPGETNLTELINNFFSAVGIDLTPKSSDRENDSPLSERKSVVFNDQTGTLYVRATLDDLDLIEQALNVVNATPQQIKIEVKFAELLDADAKALSFDWFLGNALNTITNGPVSQTETQTNAIGEVPTVPKTPAPRAPDSPESETVTNTYFGAVTGILTDPQFRTVIRALEQRSGIDVLGAPSVVTVSGRKAKIEVTELKTIVTSVTAEPKPAEAEKVVYGTLDVPLGSSVEINPNILDDGKSIQMTITAGILEFLGYDESGVLTVKSSNGANSKGGPLTAVLPLPRFRVRNVTSTATVWNGQTLVLGGFTSRIFSKDATEANENKVPLIGGLPLLGGFSRNDSGSKTNKHLILFVTPTMIDPAGYPIRTE